MEFKTFRTKKDHNQTVETSRVLAGYIHKNEFKNIILLDGSARLASIGIRKAWNNMYKGEKMPQVYFTDPTGHLLRFSTRDEIDVEFTNTYRKLIQEKDQKLLIYDTCIHTGGTMQAVKDTLDSLGFENVSFASTARYVANKDCRVSIDFFTRDYVPSKGCDIFGMDLTINKEGNVVSGVWREDSDWKSRSREVRRELIEVMKENHHPELEGVFVERI